MHYQQVFSDSHFLQALLNSTAVAIERHFRVKASTELWQFTDPDARGVKTELSFHLGAVGTF